MQSQSQAEIQRICCLQTRMQRLEGVRLEVDSRRRTVAELARKIDRQRAKLPQTRSKGEFEMEQTIKKMQHKENKLSGEISLVYQLWQALLGDPACNLFSAFILVKVPAVQEDMGHTFMCCPASKVLVRNEAAWLPAYRCCHPFIEALSA